MSKAGSIKEGFAARGGGWVLGQAALTATVIGLGWFCPGEPRQALRIAGAALLLTAALIGAAGLAAQGRRLTPFPKPRPEARLIQHGIYGLVRHPLYACNLGAFFGWAMFRASAPAEAAALAGALFFTLKARREEAWLRARFPDYGDYAKRVKRFIPWIC
jgi:protein-S-isoprenylcysteine O-methyltransferase Ste14